MRAASVGRCPGSLNPATTDSVTTEDWQIVFQAAQLGQLQGYTAVQIEAQRWFARLERIDPAAAETRKLHVELKTRHAADNGSGRKP